MATKRNRFSFGSFLSFGRAPKIKTEPFVRSEYGIWHETLNPLRGLTAQRAQDIYDRGRRGIFAELTYLYNEIEEAEPTLFVCVDRREGATASADWRVTTLDPERAPQWEDRLAKEQKQFLERSLGAAGDGLNLATEHLASAFFRGFAHVRPVIEQNMVQGFEHLNPWNFARDPATGSWWWNPDAAFSGNDNFVEIPHGELVTVSRSRHIDYPALAIFIRAALGERRWGTFLERYGIPPVTIIMPEFAEKNEESAYMSAAEKVARGGSGALPFGSSVSYATEARGTNPFEQFLDHQQRQIVLLSTGGLLTTLTAPGSGTLAGEAHMETWRAAVARDLTVVARGLNRDLVKRLLAAEFPDQPHLAMIELDANPAPTPKAIFEDAEVAYRSGYRIKRENLEERTGYQLEIVESGTAQLSPWLNSGATPLQNARITLQNRASAPDASTGGKTGTALKTQIRGLARDLETTALNAALAALERGDDAEAIVAAYDAAVATGLVDTTTAQAEALAAELEAAVAPIAQEDRDED